MIEKVALICGIPPGCDHCNAENSKVLLNLRYYGIKHLCEECVVFLVEKGLDVETDEKYP